MLKETNTPTRPRIEPGSPDPESDALTIRPVRPLFFKNGNWHRTQKKLSQHAAYALHNLFSLFKQIEFSTTQKCKLFDVLVGSILSYSAEVWGNNEAKDIELLHTKFCRWILNVRKSTNLAGLYGELGRFPLIIYRKISMIRYWIKILASGDTFIPRKIYCMLKMMLIKTEHITV